MDIVLIENLEDPNSLALVAFTTGVLTAYDSNDILEGNFEIQVYYFFISENIFLIFRKWTYAGVQCQWKKILIKM